MTKKPPPGQWGPTTQPGGLPRTPHQGEVRAGGEAGYRTRPGGPRRPIQKPPTKGPKPPKPPGRSGCGLLGWAVLALIVLILIVKAKQGH